jgi:hypothetical protein
MAPTRTRLGVPRPVSGRIVAVRSVAVVGSLRRFRLPTNVADTARAAPKQEAPYPVPTMCLEH